MASTSFHLLRRSRLLFLRLAHPPPPSTTLLRSFGTSSSSSSSSSDDADLSLLHVLQAEIKHEDRVGRLQESGIPPEPFKLLDKPGVAELFLHRSYGDEDIGISCVYHDQSYPPPDEEEGYEPPRHDVPTKMVQMAIKIARGEGKPFLEIVCCNFGKDIHIESVLLKDPNCDYKDIPYEGPDILKVGSDLKSGFLKYLASRGIDGPLGKFVIDFMCHKEQREYSRWLRKIERFVQN